jgi:hypothetical protein
MFFFTVLSSAVRRLCTFLSPKKHRLFHAPWFWQTDFECCRCVNHLFGGEPFGEGETVGRRGSPPAFSFLSGILIQP